MPLHASRRALASTPGIGIAPETTPVKYVPQMLNIQNSKWWNGRRNPYLATYREKPWSKVFGGNMHAGGKGNRVLLQRNYSPEALKAAVAMIPAGFEVRDVPRPPRRIRAQSEGIVGRWYSNFWTLHAVKYQCLLAGVEWQWGERFRPTTNFEEPHFFVDFEESKLIRDYRSRWINVNRSLVGMSKRMKEVEEEARFMAFRKHQDGFWTSRKVLVNRVKAMHNQGVLQSAKDLPIRSFNIQAFLSE
jgi:hypothetical protein